MTDLVTLHDRYVIYDPSLDQYLNVHIEVLPNDSDEYTMTWVAFSGASCVRDKYVSRIQDTFAHAITYGRSYTTEHEAVDIVLCNNILSRYDGDVHKIREIQLVPVIEHPITEDIVDCDFLLSESMFACMLEGM
jgi:hypothetical protein